jgi:hypothetical protein
MTKKIKSTVDELIESLSPEERKKYDEEYKEFLLSELILAAMAKDNEAVKTLAKMAGVSPAIKDFNMQSFFKILKGLGSKGFMIELHGKYIPLDMPASRKR